MSDPFRDLVRRVREAQKEYFATRSPNSLNRSKELERQVDRDLADDGQVNLFEDPSK